MQFLFPELSANVSVTKLRFRSPALLKTRHFRSFQELRKTKQNCNDPVMCSGETLNIFLKNFGKFFLYFCLCVFVKFLCFSVLIFIQIYGTKCGCFNFTFGKHLKRWFPPKALFDRKFRFSQKIFWGKDVGGAEWPQMVTQRLIRDVSERGVWWKSLEIGGKSNYAEVKRQHKATPPSLFCAAEFYGWRLSDSQTHVEISSVEFWS